MNIENYQQVAYKYAPIFAQKVSHEWPVADQIAPVDFAGGIQNVADNPEALYRLPEDAVIPAKIYYSVTETMTHYFIIYAVYHVLDWWKRYTPDDLYNFVRDKLDEHVHDMEGALIIVTKQPENLVDGIVTLAHGNFYLHVEPRIAIEKNRSSRAFPRSLYIVKLQETLDGNIWIDRPTLRPKLYIESRGHGIRGDDKHWGNGDEIWYYKPKGESGSPDTRVESGKNQTRESEYELEDIFAENGLWQYYYDERVFKQNKKGLWSFVHRDKNNSLQAGSANPPWSWNDRNDNSPIGEIATDPAHFIIRYAQGWGPVSNQYIYNPYVSIGVPLVA